MKRLYRTIEVDLDQVQESAERHGLDPRERLEELIRHQFEDLRRSFRQIVSRVWGDGWTVQEALDELHEERS